MIHLVDAASGQALQVLPTATRHATWVSDRYLILHQSESEPLLADLAQPLARPVPIPSHYFGLDIAYPAEIIAFASTQGVSLVSLPDGQLLHFWRLEGTEHPVQTALLSLSPDGQTLLVQAITQPPDMGPGDTYRYAIPLP